MRNVSQALEDLVSGLGRLWGNYSLLEEVHHLESS